MIRIIGFLVGAAAMSLAVPTQAGPMDGKQVTIAAKALSFLATKPPAGAKIVVVGTAAELDDVKKALPAANVVAGGPEVAAGAFAAFVGSTADAQMAKEQGVVTIGGDIACVEAGACVIAVEVTPKVSIYVSRAAASATGVDFDPNFKMMIVEK